MPYVLTISERGHSWAGRPPVATMYETRLEAEAELLEYVRRNWDSGMDGDERPHDPEEMIEQYFDFVLERYEIVQVADRRVRLEYSTLIRQN